MNLKDKIKEIPLLFKILKSIKNALLLFRNKYEDLLYLKNRGERVDLSYKGKVDIEALGVNEKCHYLRYEYAEKIIPSGSVVGDFACGTGYGSVLLAQKALRVVGVDIDERTVSAIKKRYKETQNVAFISKNILDIDYVDEFNFIVSFETIEHLSEEEIPRLLCLYHNALKKKGVMIFSTPYMQEKSEDAVKAGFHKTFDIGEEKVREWLSHSGFTITSMHYQSYGNPLVESSPTDKQFLICVAEKI